MSHTRELYIQQLLPSYLSMLDSLDFDLLGTGSMKLQVINVCGLLNNIIDYIAFENPTYVQHEWSSGNANEFRVALEKRGIQIHQTRIAGSFFGYCRDIANTAKHLAISRPEKNIEQIGSLIESLAIIRYEDDAGFYYAHKNTVLVKNIDEQYVPVEICVFFCHIMITNILTNAGFIQSTPKLDRDRRSFFITREYSKNLGTPRIKSYHLEPSSVKLERFIYTGDYPYSGEQPFPIKTAGNEDTFLSKFEIKLIVDGYSGPP